MRTYIYKWNWHTKVNEEIYSLKHTLACNFSSLLNWWHHFAVINCIKPKLDILLLYCTRLNRDFYYLSWLHNMLSKVNDFYHRFNSLTFLYDWILRFSYRLKLWIKSCPRSGNNANELDMFVMEEFKICADFRDELSMTPNGQVLNWFHIFNSQKMKFQAISPTIYPIF